jgi:hypothetical protein
MRTVSCQLQRVKMPPIWSKRRKLLFFRLTLSFYFFFCSLMFANWEPNREKQRPQIRVQTRECHKDDPSLGNLTTVSSSSSSFSSCFVSPLLLSPSAPNCRLKHGSKARPQNEWMQNKNRNLAYSIQYLRILLHRYACIAHFFCYLFPALSNAKPESYMNVLVIILLPHQTSTKNALQ